MAREHSTDSQEIKHMIGLQFKVIDQLDIKRTGPFEITRHIDPVEFGQCIVLSRTSAALSAKPSSTE